MIPDGTPTKSFSARRAMAASSGRGTWIPCSWVRARATAHSSAAEEDRPAPCGMIQANQMTGANVLYSHGSNLSAWLMWLQTRFPDTFARIEEVPRDVFPEIRQLRSEERRVGKEC